jgi:SAM-dependent methyltransferase
MGIWSHDWYLRRNVRRCIEKTVRELRLLNVAGGARVVDIGCGEMPYKEIFVSRGCEYTGCDIGGRCDVLIEEGKPVPLPGSSFDGIVSFQVLEHVWDIGWYLGESRRLLKPGGWLFLSTHGNWLYHPNPADYRRWTKEGLVRELEGRGFKVEEVKSVIGPLAWTTQFRLLGWWHLLHKLGLFGKVALGAVCFLMNTKMIVEDLITPAAISENNACVYVAISRRQGA